MTNHQTSGDARLGVIQLRCGSGWMPLLLGVLFSWRSQAAGAWAPLAHQAPAGVELMLLLSDGTVMAAKQVGGSTYSSGWYRLKPDLRGSYINGTWSTLAAMHNTRYDYASQVLKDGRVFVAGGEYGAGKAAAEVYDPLSNTWTTAPVPTALLNPASQSPEIGESQGFYDSISEILPSGNVLIAPDGASSTGGSLIYNPASNTWVKGPTFFRVGYPDQAEATWVKLPDDSILTVDPYGTNSERYIPSLNRWVKDASLPVKLFDSIGGEIGAAFLLPDGRAFWLGGTGHTAIYTPTGGVTAGAWVAGPDLPNLRVTPDAPAAMMVNGKILCAASDPLYKDTNGNVIYPAPTSFVEYDPAANSFASVDGPTGPDYYPSPYYTKMLDLPDGTVLFSTGGNSQLYIYQPDGPPLDAGKPGISNITRNADGSYHLTGTLLNGISEGAAYGDDAQMDSNYPLVRVTDANGGVHYCRTYDWSSTSVMTGNAPMTTEFTLPAGLPAGNYSLVVVANGNSSDPVPFVNPPAQPGIASVSVSGTSLVLNATNGLAGGTYYVLASADASLPLSQWTTIATNVLGGGGDFSIAFTNAVTANSSQQFYMLETTH